jgi:hypothetical protein
VPTVTLRRPRTTRTLGFGGVNHFFRVDVPVSVSTELALKCDEDRDRLGRVFDVSYKRTDADISELLGVQLEFEPWPTHLPR